MATEEGVLWRLGFLRVLHTEQRFESPESQPTWQAIEWGRRRDLLPLRALLGERRLLLELINPLARLAQPLLQLPRELHQPRFGDQPVRDVVRFVRSGDELTGLDEDAAEDVLRVWDPVRVRGLALVGDVTAK